MENKCKLGIMQPYFFPYLGYFQLMNAVDKYVMYDNIQYEKGSWINRNRVLVNGIDKFITIPLKKDSDYLDIRERVVSETFEKERKKIVNLLINSYKKAPYFESAFPVINSAIMYEDNNLFKYLYNANKTVVDYIGIKTEIIISSTLEGHHELKGEDKVLYICKSLDAIEYYNSIGGVPLYHKERFKENGIELHFTKMNDDVEYKQFNEPFIPSLSIIDVMMFNSVEKIQDMLTQYTLI